MASGWDYLKSWWNGEANGQIIQEGAKKTPYYAWVWLKQNWFVLVVLAALIFGALCLIKLVIGWLKNK